MTANFELDDDMTAFRKQLIELMGHVADHWSPEVQIKRTLGDDGFTADWYVYFDARDEMPLCETCNQPVSNIPQPRLLSARSLGLLLENAEIQFAKKDEVPA